MLEVTYDVTDENPPENSGTSHCILILNRRDITNPRAGGAEVYIHEVAKRLVKFYAIVMFSSAFSNCKSEEVIDGIKIVRCGNEFTVYLLALFYYLTSFRKFIDVIVECKDGGVPWLTQFYSTKRKIALVHQTGRGADTPFNQSVWYYEFSSKVFGYLVYLLEPLLLKAYRGIDIITPSKSTRTDLEGFGIDPKHIEVAEPGVIKDVEFQIKKSRIPTIIYLGRVNRYKRLEDVIKTFAIIKKEIPSSRLIIAGLGDSEYLDYLYEISRKMGVYEKVDFRGRVSEDEKMFLLSEAHLMLFASVREGWGISVIEANSVGTP
ncbi:MAG: glycosyltransferase family 4 protein, partial [Nitrososphaera sp.]